MNSNNSNNNRKSKPDAQGSRYYCKFCNLFVYNNKISIQRHDSDPRHEQNKQRYIADVVRQQRDREKRESEVGAELKRIDKLIQGEKSVSGGDGKSQSTTRDPSATTSTAKGKHVEYVHFNPDLLKTSVEPKKKHLRPLNVTSNDDSAEEALIDKVSHLPPPHSAQPSLTKTDRTALHHFKVREKKVDSLNSSLSSGLPDDLKLGSDDNVGGATGAYVSFKSRKKRTKPADDEQGTDSKKEQKLDIDPQKEQDQKSAADNA